MRRLRLGIDLDGVVADFNTGWVDRYNQQFATALHPGQIATWDAAPALTHFEDMTEFWLWARADADTAPANGDGEVDGHRPSIFRELPAYPDALPALHRLAGDHDVVVITSKHDWAVPDTLEWLAEHRMPSREYHFTWRKWDVDCDVYLDDAPHNLRALATQRPDALVCRYVRPWNAPTPGTVDVHDWEQFARHVERFAGAHGHPRG
jgi:5'(3')-deoxyribonucleotidase